MKKQFIMDVDEYCRLINELSFLKTLVLDFYFGEITKEKLFDKLKEENKKYIWWC